MNEENIRWYQTNGFIPNAPLKSRSNINVLYIPNSIDLQIEKMKQKVEIES